MYCSSDPWPFWNLKFEVSHCTLGCVEPEVTMSGQEGGAGEDILIVSDGGAENTQG